MPRLTKKIVDAAEPDSSRPVFVWDDQIPGFGLKVLPGGTKRYVLKYRTGAGGRSATQRWLLIGTHGAITCDQARDKARGASALVARGEDPQEKKFLQRTAPRFQDVWDRFKKEQLPLKRPSTAEDYEQIWRDHISPQLCNKPVADIRPEMIDRLHKSLAGSPYQANRTLALLSRLFNLAETWGMREHGSNPCRHVERFKETPRERYLSHEEIRRLAMAIDDARQREEISSEAARAIQLLLLTGARLNELLTARWEWVSIDARVINLPTSKTGKKTLFLSQEAIKIIEHLDQSRAKDQTSGAPQNPFLLPGRVKGKPLNNLSKPWARVCKVAGLEGVRLHDLRHTAASIAVGQGVSLSLIGRLLGHSQPQTTHRYAHVDADPALAVADLIGADIARAFSIPKAGPQ